MDNIDDQSTVARVCAEHLHEQVSALWELSTAGIALPAHDLHAAYDTYESVAEQVSDLEHHPDADDAYKAQLGEVRDALHVLEQMITAMEFVSVKAYRTGDVA